MTVTVTHNFNLKHFFQHTIPFGSAGRHYHAGASVKAQHKHGTRHFLGLEANTLSAN
jgi:hypothetical protein